MTKQEFLKEEVKALRRLGKQLFGRSTSKVDKLVTFDLSVIENKKERI